MINKHFIDWIKNDALFRFYFFKNIPEYKPYKETVFSQRELKETLKDYSYITQYLEFLYMHYLFYPASSNKLSKCGLLFMMPVNSSAHYSYREGILDSKDFITALCKRVPKLDLIYVYANIIKKHPPELITLCRANHNFTFRHIHPSPIFLKYHEHIDKHGKKKDVLFK